VEGAPAWRSFNLGYVNWCIHSSIKAVAHEAEGRVGDWDVWRHKHMLNHVIASPARDSRDVLSVRMYSTSSRFMRSAVSVQRQNCRQYKPRSQQIRIFSWAFRWIHFCRSWSLSHIRVFWESLFSSKHGMTAISSIQNYILNQIETIIRAQTNKMLSYRREAALQGALVLVKSGRPELGDNILRTLSSATVT